MITTHEITLDPKTFFRLLLRLNFKRKTKLLYALAAVMAITWIIMYPYQGQLYILLAAVCLFPILTVFLTWRTANNKMNRGFTVPRYFTITDSGITAHLAGGEQEQFEIARTPKIVCTRNYYLLFTSPIEFIYLPFAAFGSDADREWFEQSIVKRAKVRR